MSPGRRCLVCGAQVAKGHHPTGRDAQGNYLDPTLTLPLCHDHHAMIHDDWWTLGISDPEPGKRGGPRLTLVERVERRLRRLAVDIGRCAAAHPEYGWIARLAACLKRWADELASDIAARDRRDPDWRSDDGFYTQA